MKVMIDVLRKEWNVIKSAPWSFIIVVVAVCGSTSLFMNKAYDWRYGSQIEKRDTEIELLKEESRRLKESHQNPELPTIIGLTSEQKAKLIDGLRGVTGTAKLSLWGAHPDLLQKTHDIFDCLKEAGWKTDGIGTSYINIADAVNFQDVRLEAYSSNTPGLKALQKSLLNANIPTTIVKNPGIGNDQHLIRILVVK
jgi:hypothetical protein